MRYRTQVINRLTDTVVCEFSGETYEEAHHKAEEYIKRMGNRDNYRIREVA